MTEKTTNHALKHYEHRFYIDTSPVPTKKPGLIHSGVIMCADCRKHIKWATQYEIDHYQRCKTRVRTYEDFRLYLESVNPGPGTEHAIYLAIGYRDKDIAKKNGAHWDTHERLWYVYPDEPRAVNLIKYMMPDDVTRLKGKHNV